MKNGRQGSRFVNLLLIGIASIMGFSACAPGVPEKPVTNPSKTIVFVHGAWGGGWQFHKVQPLLERAGHRVYRPTMTGLGERVHLAGPEVGLETHIEDIVNVLEFEDLHGVVLIGHSYGGMVVAGVANKVPERVGMLIFMDAILPEDGESVMGLFGDGIEKMAEAGGEGAEPWQLVPRWVEEGKPRPVDVPQPIKTFTDNIVLDNPEAKTIPGAFILTVEAGKETDDFDVFAKRAQNRGWEVVKMEGSHNPHWFQPEAFVDILLKVLVSGECHREEIPS